MKLLDVQDVGPAFARASDFLREHVSLDIENLPLEQALGRRLGEDIFSSEDLPNFTRSTVDGYAVRAQDVGGATDAIPSLLTLSGEVAMGEETSLEVAPGTCVYVPTGGMIPAGADAMVMVEYTERILGHVAIYRPAASGDGILHKGSDLQEGERILEKGRRLHAYDIASLASVGLEELPLLRKPRVFIFSSGDELVPIGQALNIGQVRDSNAAGIRALAESYGWFCVGQGHLPDDAEIYESEVRRAKELADLVVVSGGSSKGARDYTASTFDALGEPGVFVHGIAMKPGKPTILGGVDRTLLVGLPGHPVSALLVWERLLEALELALYGEGARLPEEKAVLAENVAGSPGQERILPATLFMDGSQRMVRPLAGRSGQVSFLSRANALILLPKGAEGAAKGDQVSIRLIRREGGME